MPGPLSFHRAPTRLAAYPKSPASHDQRRIDDAKAEVKKHQEVIAKRVQSRKARIFMAHAADRERRYWDME